MRLINGWPEPNEPPILSLILNSHEMEDFLPSSEWAILQWIEGVKSHGSGAIKVFQDGHETTLLANLESVLGKSQSSSKTP